jgi:hypothetical protein
MPMLVYGTQSTWIAICFDYIAYLLTIYEPVVIIVSQLCTVRYPRSSLARSSAQLNNDVGRGVQRPTKKVRRGNCKITFLSTTPDERNSLIKRVAPRSRLQI